MSRSKNHEEAQAIATAKTIRQSRTIRWLIGSIVFMTIAFVVLLIVK